MLTFLSAFCFLLVGYFLIKDFLPLTLHLSVTVIRMHILCIMMHHDEGPEELLGAQPSPELSLPPEILQSQMTMVP